MSAWGNVRALEAGYQPFILRAFRNRGHRGRKSCPISTYALWAISSGDLRFSTAEASAAARRAGLSLPVIAPAAILITPAVPLCFEAPPGVDLFCLIFDVWARPRRKSPKSPVFSSLSRTLQPAPEDVFGVKLPPRIPAAETDACLRMVKTCCHEWWLGPLERLRANARLGLWLAEYACRQGGDRPDGSWVGRVRTVAGTGIEHGATARSIAAEMGITAQLLSTRLRRECGKNAREFLDAMRMERARSLLESGYTLAKTAKECGYRSVDAFIRRFHAVHGLPPRQWKEDSHAL